MARRWLGPWKAVSASLCRERIEDNRGRNPASHNAHTSRQKRRSRTDPVGVRNPIANIRVVLRADKDPVRGLGEPQSYVVLGLAPEHTSLASVIVHAPRSASTGKYIREDVALQLVGTEGDHAPQAFNVMVS